MEADLKINQHLSIPGSELSVTTSRSGGPGGQHVNKTDSKVSLRWNIEHSEALTDQQREYIKKRLSTRILLSGDLVVNAEDERSQLRNREIARQRLAELIASALIPIKKRIATKATYASKARRIDSKKRRSSIKKLRRFSGDS